MLFGVITCLVSVVLLGIDGQFVSPSVYPQVSQHNRIFIFITGKVFGISVTEKKVIKKREDKKKKVYHTQNTHRSVSLISLGFSSFFFWGGANNNSTANFSSKYEEKLNFEIFVGKK